MTNVLWIVSIVADRKDLACTVLLPQLQLLVRQWRHRQRADPSTLLKVRSLPKPMLPDS